MSLRSSHQRGTDLHSDKHSGLGLQVVPTPHAWSLEVFRAGLVETMSLTRSLEEKSMGEQESSPLGQ